MAVLSPTACCPLPCCLHSIGVSSRLAVIPLSPFLFHSVLSAFFACICLVQHSNVCCLVQPTKQKPNCNRKAKGVSIVPPIIDETILASIDLDGKNPRVYFHFQPLNYYFRYTKASTWLEGSASLSSGCCSRYCHCCCCHSHCCYNHHYSHCSDYHSYSHCCCQPC